jgi:hypothetical protein
MLYYRYRTDRDIDMNKQQGFLATFRIDENLWGKFKAIAKDKRTNASSLIIGYIQGVVNAGGVDDFGVSPVQQVQSISYADIDKYIDEKIKLLSLQQAQPISYADIDKYLDEKIKLLSVQQAESISLQDIDKYIDEKIKEESEALKKLILENITIIFNEWEIPQVTRKEIDNSLKDGEIGAKLQFNSENTINYIDDIDSKLVEVKDTVVEQINSADLNIKPADEPDILISKDSDSNKVTTEDKAYVIKLLGIEDIIKGKPYSAKNIQIFKLLRENQKDIEKRLKISIKTQNKYLIKELNQVINALGYKYGSRQSNRKNIYFVLQGKEKRI